MASVENALETVFDSDHRHDLVTFKVRSDGDEWTLQFTTGGDPVPVWNVAGHPPALPEDRWERVDEQSGNRFTSDFAVVESDAETADEAADEAYALIKEVGGSGSEVYRTGTAVVGKPTLIGNVKSLAAGCRERVRGVLG